MTGTSPIEQMAERLRRKATWNDFDPATQDDFAEAADLLTSIEADKRVLREALREAVSALRQAHKEAALAIREFDGGDVHCTMYSVAADNADAALTKVSEQSV